MIAVHLRNLVTRFLRLILHKQEKPVNGLKFRMACALVDVDVKKEKTKMEEDGDVKLWESIKDKCVKADFPNVNVTRFRQRPLEDQDKVYEQNAWDNIEWEDDMKAEAVSKVQTNSKTQVEDKMKELYESEASQFWDKFYGVHQNKFFKQRNWLLNEFPELLGSYERQSEPETLEEKRTNESFPGEKSKFRVLEIGCGNGSTVFPLLATNVDPDLYVYCCDFSPLAVDVVASSTDFDQKRCFPFVWDVTSEDLSALPFPPGSLHAITVIFVLCAISPQKLDRVMSNLSILLQPGGLILFRDYGLHDMVQLRFPDGRCISTNFYVRGDGTRVYFFTKDEIEGLFEKHGLRKSQLFVDRRLQVNRGKEIKMYRIWIQGKFYKAGT